MAYINALKYYFVYRNSYFCSEKQFQNWQKDDLIKLIKGTFPHVPAYESCNSKFRSGWPGSVSQILARFPIIKKNEIRQKGVRFYIDRRFPFSKLAHHRTSGSTGEPFETLWDSISESRKMANNLRAYSFAGCLIGTKYVHLSPPMKKTSSRLVATLLELIRRYDYDIFTKDYFALASKIVNARPEYIIGHVSSLKAVAEVLKEKKITIPGIKGLITSGELMLPETRLFLEEVYQAKTWHTYGTTETGTMAVECDRHCGYHLNPRAAIIEILDENDTAVPYGESGRIVVTSLLNRAMPLIRYDTGDRGSLTNDVCACGQQIPRLQVVEGRQIDLLLRKDGTKIPPFLVSLSLKPFLPYIRQYQFTQHTRIFADFKFIAKKKIPPEKLQDLESLLRGLLGIEVKIEIVSSLPHQGRKLRYIRNLFPGNQNL